MVSIFSLPPEILIYVFSVYLHEMVEDSVIEEKSDSIELCPAGASRPPHWRWLVLVQVCRAWNTTVSSSPLLGRGYTPGQKSPHILKSSKNSSQGRARFHSVFM